MAKYRLDYVTNSSSSSFIIAKNNKCTEEEIKELLYSMEEQISNVIGRYCWDYKYDDDDDNVSEKTINEFIDEMTSHLYCKGDLILGEWSVSAREYNNESDEYNGFMYEYGHKLNTENLKVQCSGW